MFKNKKLSAGILVIVQVILILILQSKLNIFTVNKPGVRSTNFVNETNNVKFSVTGKCYRNTVTFPNYSTFQDTWMVVDLHKTAYIFSAYVEEKYNNLTIIGAKKNNTKGYTCQLWYISDEDRSIVELEEVSASADELLQEKKRQYNTALFRCMNPKSQVPNYVSITNGSCIQPFNLLRVHWIEKLKRPNRKFTYCLSPLFRYTHTYEIVEWIELNKLLGAEMFVIYNHSTSQNVTKILEYYSQRHMVEIVQWSSFPTIDIHYYGQSPALNDCLFRNRQLSEFIVVTDVDEFIIPRSINVITWRSMFLELSNDSAGYYFRHVFFSKDWDDTNTTFPQKDIAIRLKLTTLQKTVREAKVWPFQYRTKYFARPLLTSSVGIHNVTCNSGQHIHVVSTSIGLLHHYRQWQDESNNQASRIDDRIIVNKYSQALIKRVQETWSQLGSLKIQN